MAKKEISNERKTLYYIGMGLTAIGAILFISTFFTFFSFMNPDTMFEDGPSFIFSFMGRPVIGMVLMIVGSIIRTVAVKGVAGSGLVLDPKKAREDLSPWTHMAGGMINDVLDKTPLNKKAETSSVKEIIKIRCKNCSELNDEDAKFCKNCGEKL